jgi:hypothetical protein
VIILDFLLNELPKYAANKYWSDWYAKNKEHFKGLVNFHKKKRRQELQKVIEEYKSVPCKKCKKKYHTAAMDFVHRKSEDKKFSIRDATRLIHSVDKLIEELKKCDVYCANCMKEIKVKKFLKETNGKESRNRRRKKLKEIIDGMKSNSCGDCGKKYPPYVMELDHLDGGKKVDSVSKMINKERPIEMILEELKKTEPICTNCHRIRTYRRSHEEK